MTVAPARPCGTRRFTTGTASHGRRIHVFFDAAVTAVSFDRRALCAGVRALTVLDEATGTLDWPADPFTPPLTSADVTCARCWDSYERHLIAKVTPLNTTRVQGTA